MWGRGGTEREYPDCIGPDSNLEQRQNTHTEETRLFWNEKRGDLTSHKSSAAILHKNSFLGEIDTTMTENDVSLRFFFEFPKDIGNRTSRPGPEPLKANG